MRIYILTCKNFSHGSLFLKVKESRLETENDKICFNKLFYFPRLHGNMWYPNPHGAAVMHYFGENMDSINKIAEAKDNFDGRRMEIC